MLKMDWKWLPFFEDFQIFIRFLLLDKVEALCVLVKSCRVSLLFSSLQLFLFFASFFSHQFLLLAAFAVPPLPDLFSRWGGHVPAASVAAPGLGQPESLSHPWGPAEGRPFSLEGRKGSTRAAEKWLLQPGAGPASFPANQRSRQRRASWLLGCATNPVSARPSSCTMALTKSTGRIVLLSPGSWQLKTLWVQPSSLESSTMLLCDLNIFNFICIARKSWNIFPLLPDFSQDNSF